MPQFRTTRRVHHSAETCSTLVADVERYPQFLPLCTGMRVLRRETKGEGVDVLVAKMTVAYSMIRETFTSRVTLDRPNMLDLVEYLTARSASWRTVEIPPGRGDRTATWSSTSPTSSRAACSAS